MRPPIFTSDPQMVRQSNTGLYVLFGCAGCGCLCAMLAVLSFIFLGVVVELVEQQGEMLDRPAMNMETDFNLYGKTLDDEDFDWESLRGQYVLVKFTATWCPPCKAAIPGMLDTYEKYHDKGFEIVSVYIGEMEPNAVATVRRFVEQEKLPWIILSESLTVKGGQPPQGQTFGIEYVPMMVLVDKEGKVIAVGDDYKQVLRKAFEK